MKFKFYFLEYIKCTMVLMEYRKCIWKIPDIACNVLIIVSSPNQIIFFLLYKFSFAVEGLNGRTTQNLMFYSLDLVSMLFVFLHYCLMRFSGCPKIFFIQWLHSELVHKFIKCWWFRDLPKWFHYVIFIKK